jgi:hypothetical protein
VILDFSVLRKSTLESGQGFQQIPEKEKISTEPCGTNRKGGGDLPWTGNPSFLWQRTRVRASNNKIGGSFPGLIANVSSVLCHPLPFLVYT